MNSSPTRLFTPIALLLTGLLFGWILFGGPREPVAPTVQGTETTTNSSEVWTCSMHPTVREDGPGSCPICGMDLIPASSDVREDDFSMEMTERAIQLANIQTTPVIQATPERRITLPGRIAVDERRIHYVTTHFEGRVHNMNIDVTGAPIRRGEVMASIYSQEVVQAQRELLEAYQIRDRNPGMYEAAVRKFRLWEFTDRQIQRILDRGDIQTHMEILSPVDGYVLERNIVPGLHVMEGTVLYEVANLDRVWVTLNAYEEDLQWMAPGDRIEFTTRANPGQTHEAVVDFMDPVVDPQSRTVRVRADIDNRNGRLRPDMLVTGILHAGMEEQKRMIPVSAVLWTGPRSLVYVKDTHSETHRFTVREVELGPKSGDHYVVEDGLELGEEVVFHGAFRVDSEFQLADRFSMMNRQPGSGAMPAGHQHGQSVEAAHPIETDREHFQDVSSEFRASLSDAVNAYLAGKDAFVESNLTVVKESFTTFREILQRIGEHGLSGDGHMAWLASWSRLMEKTESITGASELEEARHAFRSLSEELILAVHLFGVEGVVYHQHCPMAFDNEGGDWISQNEPISNPYLPETMLRCGSVIDRIE